MVGASEAALARVLPLLQPTGRSITHVGGSGDGRTTKVADRITVALNVAAVSEALLFASKAGADPAKVRQALMGGFASSRILEVHGERMIKRRFNPGFRIGLHQKDTKLALQGAKSLGVALPQHAGAVQLMRACAAQGRDPLDRSAPVTALEHGYGCGAAIDAPGAVVPIRTPRNISPNPDFGGKVMVLSLGCKKLRPERLLPSGSFEPKDERGALDARAASGGALDVVCVQDEAHVGFMSMAESIVRQAEVDLPRLQAWCRETVPAGEPVVGVQCG